MKLASCKSPSAAFARSLPAAAILALSASVVCAKARQAIWTSLAALGTANASYIDSMAGTIYGDLPKQEALDFEYRILNYRERGYEQIPFTGLSADYVSRETKRAMDGAEGTKTLIWPGIDIDIPTGRNQSKSTRQGTKDAVMAAFGAGAHGVILSRKYSEMMLANLSGAGDAVRELKLA